MVIKISFAIFMGLVYNIYKDIRLRAYRFYAASIQIGIWRQGRQPSRAFHLRNRKFPDPLGIVLWCSKLEFAEGSQGIEQRVIPNQCAHWCGNLHRIPDDLSSYRLFYPAVSRNSSTKNCSSIREIATPVCALARNDTEFAKFQFVSVLTTIWQLPVMVSLRDE